MIPLSLTVVHLIYRIDFVAGGTWHVLKYTCSSISAAEPLVFSTSAIRCCSINPLQLSRTSNLEFYSPLHNDLYTHLSLSVSFSLCHLWQMIKPLVAVFIVLHAYFVHLTGKLAESARWCHVTFMENKIYDSPWRGPVGRIGTFYIFASLYGFYAWTRTHSESGNKGAYM